MADYDNPSAFDAEKVTPREGKVTQTVERTAAQISSLRWLWMALGSLAVSAGLAGLTRRKNIANFLGLWVPTLLLFGIYNKIVKTNGSDFLTKQEYLH